MHLVIVIVRQVFMISGRFVFTLEWVGIGHQLLLT